MDTHERTYREGMSTTTREPRKALLSDEKCEELDMCDCRGSHGSFEARAFYENLITSGELRVQMTVKRKEFMDHVRAHEANEDMDLETYLDAGYQRGLPCCPGCGARIIP